MVEKKQKICISISVCLTIYLSFLAVLANANDDKIIGVEPDCTLLMEVPWIPLHQPLSELIQAFRENNSQIWNEDSGVSFESKGILERAMAKSELFFKGIESGDFHERGFRKKPNLIILWFEKGVPVLDEIKNFENNIEGPLKKHELNSPMDFNFERVNSSIEYMRTLKILMQGISISISEH